MSQDENWFFDRAPAVDTRRDMVTRGTYAGMRGEPHFGLCQPVFDGLSSERVLDAMTKMRMLFLCLLLAIATAGFAPTAPSKPKTVIHVITIQWKAGATPEQIQQVIRAAENINYPGIKNVWTKPIKMQLPEGYKHIIVMEFESEEALKKYAGSPAQKQWYEVYMPIREESSTHDITN
jgi:hypothetical protein